MKKFLPTPERNPVFYRNFTLGKLLFICITPVVLLLLPADFFDHGGPALCLSKILFDTNCPACGMTRACQHLIHLDFENAFAYNMASFLVMPALAIVWAQWFFKELRTWKKLRNAKPGLAGQ